MTTTARLWSNYFDEVMMTTVTNLSIWSASGGDEAFFSDVHTKLVKEAAARRGVEIESVHQSVFLLKHGGRTVLFDQHMPELTSAASRSISNDKHASKVFLERAGVHTPKGEIFSYEDLEKGIKYANRIGYPVVIKPLTGTGGTGVTSNIQNDAHFRAAWDNVGRAGSYIVEKHVDGTDYRLFVVNGRFICAIKRIPVNITGDGKSTVVELIDKKNIERSVNPYVSTKKVRLRPEMLRILKTHGFTKQSVIPDGVRIELMPVANIGTGGDSVDVTDMVHPGFAEIAVSAAHAIPGCFYAGVDLLVPDISRSPAEQTYVVCEINTRCDIGLHHFPISGQARDAAGALIEAMFPDARPVPDAMKKKVKVTLRGPVIGTGTRKRVRNLASLNHVTGWVKNEGDEVKALLCGSESAVNRVLLTMAARPSVFVSTEAWSGDSPDQFEILEGV